MQQALSNSQSHHTASIPIKIHNAVIPCRIAQQEREAAEQEAAAASGRISTEEDLRKVATKSSPYNAPGGRWSSFRSYSVWQRSFMIWGFAFRFFFKLWLVGKKFTYGKKVCS